MDIPSIALSGVIGGLIGAAGAWFVADSKTRARIDTLERQVTRLNSKLGSAQAAGPWWLQVIQGILSNPEILQKVAGAVVKKDDFATNNDANVR